MFRLAPFSYWVFFPLILEAETLAPWIQRCISRKRVIATLFFIYAQVCEYVSFQYFVRRMEIGLSVVSASTPIRQCIEATKGVK